MTVLARLKDRLQAWGARTRRVRAVDVAWRAFGGFRQHGDTMYAAAIAYYVLFSLFPLLIFAVAAFGFVIRDQDLQERVVDAIMEQIPEEANLREQVQDVVGGVSRSNNSLLGLAGLLGTAWTASGMFGALRQALNRAFDVPGARPFLRAKVIDLLGVVGVMALALLSVSATAALGVLRAVASDLFAGLVPNLLWGLLYLLVPLSISFLTFLLVYRVIPSRTLGVSRLWIGALVGSLGFEAAKAGFGLYLANFGRYQEVYGALGGVVAFLFFVFLVANILLYGAELASTLARDRATPARQAVGGVGIQGRLGGRMRVIRGGR
ncbi:MAG TPA: YihY/virulence factor BrkB family protein [Dehalococcoidia bacterium]